MSRQETVLSVFVASPSDVDEERNRLEEVIRELNVAWARELGIRFDLVRWETHTYPSFGEDAQDVINEQIPNDYDLFIGLMWHRFGTSTKRAESGTIEEFQRAKERFDRDPSSVQLMIYFKDAPIAPSKLDHSQLAKVTKFQSSLGEKGGLYWTFVSVEEFEKIIRLHLTQYVQSWRSKHLSAAQPMSSIESPTESEEDSDSEVTDLDDEPGILDLMELFEDEFAILTEITQRMTTAISEIGEKMAARTEEVQKYGADPDSNRKTIKRIIAKTAMDMDQYVYKMEAELPLYSQHLSTGMNALVKTAEMTVEFNIESDDIEQIEENLISVREFHDEMAIVEKHIVEFQGTIRSIPRMTTTLNRSKRAMVNVLQRLIEELQGGQAMVREAETSLTSILKSK